MGSQSVTSPFTCSLVILTLQWTQRWFPSSIFTDEQPLFNAMGHPIKENLDKVICTCTYRMNQRISKHGVSVPLWGLQKSNMKLQSYFDIGNHTRNSNFSDVLNLWCFSFYFFFFFLQCNEYLKNIPPAPFKTPLWCQFWSFKRNLTATGQTPSAVFICMWKPSQIQLYLNYIKMLLL